MSSPNRKAETSLLCAQKENWLYFRWVVTSHTFDFLAHGLTLCLSKKNKQRLTHFPFSSYHVVFKPLNKITVGIGMGAFATQTLPWLLFALAERRHLSTHACAALSAAGHTPTHLGLMWPCSFQRELCTSYSGVNVFLSLFLPGFSVTFRSDLSSKKASQMLESVNPLHSVLITLYFTFRTNLFCSIHFSNYSVSFNAPLTPL